MLKIGFSGSFISLYFYFRDFNRMVRIKALHFASQIDAKEFAVSDFVKIPNTNSQMREQ